MAALRERLHQAAFKKPLHGPLPLPPPAAGAMVDQNAASRHGAGNGGDESNVETIAGSTVCGERVTDEGERTGAISKVAINKFMAMQLCPGYD